MKSKKLIIILSLGIVLIGTFTLLMSYAYWKVKRVQPRSNKAASACLSIKLSEPGDNGFSLDDAWPVTDEEGMRQAGYSFVVKNKCEDAISYQVVLDSSETGININSEYIKVQLDNQVIRRYKTLEPFDPDSISSGIAESKKVYTGIIPGKENGVDGQVSHTLKMWLSYDTPKTEIGKKFKSKVRVVGGQELTESLIVSSNPSQPKATINNIAIGDRLRYKSEEFYVIGIDGNNVKLLARYLINVGEHTKPGPTVGLQDSEIGRTRKDVNDSNSAVVYADYSTSPYATYGAGIFSDNSYWLDNTRNYLEPYHDNSFVYNEQSNIKQYVDEYVNSLRTMGLAVNSGTILDIETVGVLCNSDLTTSPWAYRSCPNYILETNYWLGSLYLDTLDMLWVVDVEGIGTAGYEVDYEIGIRPVINITLD